jgi:hypothetical protein
MVELICLFLVAYALLAALFPHELAPFLITKPRGKKVGPSYWGVYPGISTDNDKHIGELELPAPRSRLTALVGSQRYSHGKGVGGDRT